LAFAHLFPGIGGHLLQALAGPRGAGRFPREVVTLAGEKELVALAAELGAIFVGFRGGLCNAVVGIGQLL